MLNQLTGRRSSNFSLAEVGEMRGGNNHNAILHVVCALACLLAMYTCYLTRSCESISSRLLARSSSVIHHTSRQQASMSASFSFLSFRRTRL